MNMDLPRRLTMDELPRAVEVLAQAFEPDPMWVYLLPNLRQRQSTLRRFFRVLLRPEISGGQAYGAGDPLQAVAVWNVPDSDHKARRAISLPDLLSLVFSPFTLTLPRALPVFTRFAPLHDKYAPELHYYLNTIGVAPEGQGKGFASQLIKPFLAQAAQRGYAAYTETTTPSNVSLYEHYGFKTMEQYDVPRTDLHLWVFYRAKER
jgi:ribosomal protein S18 acetylase RimI-like enzyme